MKKIYIPCKKKMKSGRKIERTYMWGVRDPNCDGNIKIFCNGCFCHFAVNNSTELEKYNFCPKCGIPMDKSYAMKQLESPEIKKRILAKRVRDTVENWPQWKKDYAKNFNYFSGYEPLDFP